MGMELETGAVVAAGAADFVHCAPSWPCFSDMLGASASGASVSLRLLLLPRCFLPAVVSGQD